MLFQICTDVQFQYLKCAKAVLQLNCSPIIMPQVKTDFLHQNSFNILVKDRNEIKLVSIYKQSIPLSTR